MLAAVRHLLIALVVLAVGAPVASAQPGILYSADARGATVTTSGSALRISLPAAARTTWFTDRPARRAGTTTLARLVRTWDAAGFAEDPPNAALLLTHRGVTRTHVVTLTNPRLRGGRATFRVRGVRGGQEAGHAHRHRLRSGRYGSARLFIDDSAYPPCGTTTSTMTTTSTCLLPVYGTTSLKVGLATSTTRGMTTTAKACSTGASFTVQAPGGTVVIPTCGTYATVSSVTVCSTDMTRPATFTNRASSGVAASIQLQISTATSTTTACVPRYPQELGPCLPTAFGAQTLNTPQQCLLAPGASMTLTTETVTHVSVCASGLSGSFGIAGFDPNPTPTPPPGTTVTTVVPGCGTDTTGDATLGVVMSPELVAACTGIDTAKYTNPLGAPASLRITMTTAYTASCIYEPGS